MMSQVENSTPWNFTLCKELFLNIV
jgi:hypothetical protein